MLVSLSFWWSLAKCSYRVCLSRASALAVVMLCTRFVQNKYCILYGAGSGSNNKVDFSSSPTAFVCAPSIFAILWPKNNNNNNVHYVLCWTNFWQPVNLWVCAFRSSYICICVFPTIFNVWHWFYGLRQLAAQSVSPLKCLPQINCRIGVN